MENTRILVGRSIGLKDTQLIRGLLLSREDIDSVESIKSEYLGSHAMKVTAEIKYNTLGISEKVLLLLTNDISALARTPKQQQEIRKILEKGTDALLTHTTEVLKALEPALQEKYPHIIEIDLEQSKANVDSVYKGKTRFDT